jgi:hypothetical protein
VVRRSTGPDKLTVEALYLRCEGLCEGCGQPLRGERGPELGGHQVSHRGPRGKGGTRRAEINDVQNLMLLNEDCHRWIEDAGRGWAYDHGFLVRSGFVPALQPVWLYGVPWGERGEQAPSKLKVLLTDDAGYRPVEDVTP